MDNANTECEQQQENTTRNLDKYTYTYMHPHRRLHLVLRKVVMRLGRLYIVISDEVERRLRLEVVKRLGGKKGALSSAIEEALKDWLKKS